MYILTLKLGKGRGFERVTSMVMEDHQQQQERQQCSRDTIQHETNYPFLAEDEEAKLSTLFCNHVSLGQFELARAAIVQLAELNPLKSLFLLRKLVVSPPQQW